MATVSGIREVRGLVEISLDGVVWLRICKQHFHEHALSEGEFIDPQAYVDSIASIQINDCYEAALNILDRAACTAGNMQSKLIRAGYVHVAAEATVARLQENHLIDDRSYAERIIQSQQAKSMGAYALRRKLQAKQLNEADIDAAMEAITDEQQKAACLAVATKLHEKYADLPAHEAKAKLSQALSRRGFGWETIRTVVDETMSQQEEWS